MKKLAEFIERFKELPRVAFVCWLFGGHYYSTHGSRFFKNKLSDGSICIHCGKQEFS